MVGFDEQKVRGEIIIFSPFLPFSFFGSCQKWGAKCHFTTLNSVLAPLNSVFAPIVGAKMRCHFNNSIFFY